MAVRRICMSLSVYRPSSRTDASASATYTFTGTASRAHLPAQKPSRKSLDLTTRSLASFTTDHGSPSTIFAPATPPGKSAIAIVRVSGPDARRVWEGMVQPRQGMTHKEVKATPTWPPPARKAMLRAICDPKNRDKIDEGLVLFFPGARVELGPLFKMQTS